jgi:hypothetical protein
VTGLHGYPCSTGILEAAGLAGKIEAGIVQYFLLMSKVFVFVQVDVDQGLQ